jgi:hypothetical protein
VVGEAATSISTTRTILIGITSTAAKEEIGSTTRNTAAVLLMVIVGPQTDLEAEPAARGRPQAIALAGADSEVEIVAV